MNKEVISLKEIVGGGYSDFWHFKGRYRVCKGSRASKKSKTTALNLIVRMIEYPLANILVVRNVYSTLKDSCYTELCWAIHRLKMDNFFECKTSPLEIMYIPTGQKIYFRGLDDPLKITSITVKTGSLCWLWIEEAYEITNEDDFNMLDESIRGSVDKSIFKQITITLNPWNERHWIKARFFDVKDNNIMAKSTNYMCNEWLDESDLKVFEDMKKNNPRRYQVAGLGNWGITDGLVYENWQEKIFDAVEVSKMPSVKSIFGLDFGYTNDPTALFCGLIDTSNNTLYVFDEMYEKAMTNEDIAKTITSMGYAKEKIRADSAEPKSIHRLKTLGISRIKSVKKGAGSINAGIDFIQCCKILIHPKCQNFIREIGNYTWDKDKLTGTLTNKPIDDNNHLMDAMRYALEDDIRGRKGLGFLV